MKSAMQKTRERSLIAANARKISFKSRRIDIKERAIPAVPCALKMELSMMRMWGDVHDGKWLSCMAGDAMIWPAASSKITAPKLLDRERRGQGARSCTSTRTTARQRQEATSPSSCWLSGGPRCRGCASYTRRETGGKTEARPR